MHKRVKREKPVKIENEQKGGRSGEAAGRVWRPPVVGGSPRRSKLLSHFQLEMKKKMTTKSPMPWSDKYFCVRNNQNQIKVRVGTKICLKIFFVKKNITNISFVQFQVVDLECLKSNIINLTRQNQPTPPDKILADPSWLSKMDIEALNPKKIMWVYFSHSSLGLSTFCTDASLRLCFWSIFACIGLICYLGNGRGW